MQTEVKPRPNQLGIGGWFWGGNYKIERYLYILHRVTGVGLILFAMFHLFETTVMRNQGESVWEMTMRFLANPIFEIGLILVGFAFVIHMLNGARLIVQELGYLLGRPQRPVYPYSDAIRRKRGTTMIFMAVIIVLMVVFVLNRFIGGAV
jgi:succinate dehydrogenase / fumarate reductase, cytochrome b subunit